MSTKILLSLLYYFKTKIQLRMWVLRTPVPMQERTKQKQYKIQQHLKYLRTGSCLLLVSIMDRKEKGCLRWPDLDSWVLLTFCDSND